jgi:N-acetylmuramoyl-L-alanine amidase
MNNNLKGIIIDPGHGGIDSGAVANNQKEKDYNLKISKYMYNRFKELGIPVEITREEDVTLNPTDRVDKILSFGNDKDIILISNHLNSGGGEGTEIIYALRNDSNLANNIINNIKQTGSKTRKIYQRRLPTNMTKDYYFIHRNTKNIEPLIIEYGFIDNKDNLDFLNNNYQELAEAVIKGILNYKGIPYIPPTGSSLSTYIVKKGDTLYSIANKYNTTVENLKKQNNLTSNTLSIGQILKIIPTKIESTYIVKEGDTLYSIANKYNTTVDNLKELNNLTSNILTIGSKLKVPEGKITETTIPNNEEYIVKVGDTIYSIARKYNLTIEELKKLNNKNNNTISIGEILLIPSTKITTTYIVEKGDTLYSIANKFNTTTDKLKELNNLTNTNLSIGQELTIN